MTTPLDLPVAVTFFAAFSATRKHEERLSLRALAPMITATTASAKANLPWLKLARFGTQRTENRSLRHDANVLAVSGIEADYDGEIITVDQACDTLVQQGVAALVYTSPSCSEDGPRWRILCPLSTEAEPEKRRHFLGRLNGLFGGVLASESFTLSQAYYYGSVNRNPSHRVELVDGTPIDLHDDLDEIWRGSSKADSPNAVARKTSPLGLRARDVLLVPVAACAIPNTSEPDWEYWNRICMLIWAATGGSELGRVIWHAWSERNPAYDAAVTDERWQHWHGSPPTEAGAGSLFNRAEQASPGWWRPVTDRAPAGAGGNSDARRSEIARMAFRLARRGVAGARIVERVRDYNQRCETPLPEEAVNQTLSWAAKRLAERSHAARG